MRTLRNVLLGIVLVAALAGCGSDGDDAPAADSTSSPEPASSADGDAPAGDSPLPEGTYRTTELTMDDLQAALKARDRSGAADTLAFTMGPDVLVTHTLKIEGGRWTQFESVNGGPDEIGSSATYEVVDDSTLVIEEACCGKSTFEYTVEGDELTLRFAEFPPGGREDDVLGVAVYESAPFTKID